MAARCDAPVHPGGRSLDATKAVKVRSDHVTCGPCEAVVGDNYQLFARIGMREESHSTHALSGERAERGADTAAVRIPKKRSRVGRSGEADIDRHTGRPTSKIGTIYGSVRTRIA